MERDSMGAHKKKVIPKPESVENNLGAPMNDTSIKITIDKVFQERGITGYKFAYDKLNSKPNLITSIRKAKDMKLSTLVKLAKLLDCDINDLFEAEGYTRKPHSPSKK